MSKKVSKKNTSKSKTVSSKKDTSKQKVVKITISKAVIKKNTKKVVVTDSDSIKDKNSIIQNYALRQGDTGSPEVQTALLSQKITNLMSHLQNNPKDNHSRRGLLKIVAKRRRILNYLNDKDAKRYKELIKRLDLKK